MAKKEEDDIFQIRITDKGAIHGALQEINSLILIASILSHKKITTVKELVEDLKTQLQKTLKWMDRIPDGTLYNLISREEAKVIRRDAKTVLKWKIVPTEKEYKKHQKAIKEWEKLQDNKEERKEDRLKIMPDTSFLVSYLSGGDDNYESSKVLVNYLKTQGKYFDLYLPNFVLLEFISKLKQQHSIKVAQQKFEELIIEINNHYVVVSDQNLSLFNIFERYQKFAKKQISSQLKSNDFIIATDGILAEAVILTCDKKMYNIVWKFYKNIFLINKNPSSYTKFINAFEKAKKKLDRDKLVDKQIKEIQQNIK